MPVVYFKMSDQVKGLIRTRAVRKGLITQDFKLLDSLSDDQVNVPLLDQYINSIESNKTLIEECDNTICEEMQEAVTDAELEATLETNRRYHFSVVEKLANLKLKRDELRSQNLPSPSVENHPVENKVVKLPLPPIQINPFENNIKNPFEYFNFKKAFCNALAGMPNLTNAQKLIYLKGYLLGDALKLVENIVVDDNGYDLAFGQLDYHYLDKKDIIDRTLEEILNWSDVRQLKEVEPLIRAVHNKVLDLKGLNINLLEDNSSGLLLFSKIINRKLPRYFMLELSRVTGNNHPDFNELLNNYQSIIGRLRLGSTDNFGAKPKVKSQSNVVTDENYKSKISNVKQLEKSKLGNAASVSFGKCKLCPGTGHATSKCFTYIFR